MICGAKPVSKGPCLDSYLLDVMDCIGPLLIGSEPQSEERSETNPSASASWKELPRHRDEDQVQLDVNRAFVYYPNGEFDSTTTPVPRGPLTLSCC